MPTPNDLPKSTSPYRKDVRDARILASAEETRLTIQIAKLVKFLEDVATGKIKDPGPNRIRAAEILLKKVMPDMTAVKNEIAAEGITFLIATSYTPKPALLLPAVEIARVAPPKSEVVDAAASIPVPAGTEGSL